MAVGFTVPNVDHHCHPPLQRLLPASPVLNSYQTHGPESPQLLPCLLLSQLSFCPVRLKELPQPTSLTMGAESLPTVFPSTPTFAGQLGRFLSLSVIETTSAVCHRTSFSWATSQAPSKFIPGIKVSRRNAGHY